jgi:hypothetical protein
VNWDPSDSIYLMAQPTGTPTWGSNAVPIVLAVAAGASVDLSFDVKAPSQPGSYDFQWRLGFVTTEGSQDFYGPFGVMSALVVNVQ